MRLLTHLLFVVILTVLTQVGGVLYVFHLPLYRRIRKRFSGYRGALAGSGSFILLLIVASLGVVPPLARAFGRVPLPVYATAEIPLGPGRWFTVLANRHYVDPELRAIIQEVARQTAVRYPGTELRYLDANFPFFESFPLLPHRSHDDGGKLDISFLYVDETGKRVIASPGFLGYGYVEAPVDDESNKPAECARNGYWQYSLLRRLSWGAPDVYFDQRANAWLLGTLATHPGIGKVFIEPHLTSRLGLESNPKVRFHGCAAVRHDDHIHVQQ